MTIIGGPNRDLIAPKSASATQPAPASQPSSAEADFGGQGELVTVQEVEKALHDSWDSEGYKGGPRYNREKLTATLNALLAKRVALLVKQAEQAAYACAGQIVSKARTGEIDSDLRSIQSAIHALSPGDALEAVRIEAQIEELELAEEKMGHNQVSASHDGCWLCERKYSLQQKRAKLGENTGIKP